MNPADRKVVHDTANGIDGVRTVSEGEEAPAPGRAAAGSGLNR